MKIIALLIQCSNWFSSDMIHQPNLYMKLQYISCHIFNLGKSFINIILFVKSNLVVIINTDLLNNIMTFSPSLAAARLPFKRINPMPKENQPPKRHCAHSCPESGPLDGDNENDSSHPVQSGPPLVNGRGPLDCFLSRKRPAPSPENVTIDLTAEESRSPLKCLVPPASASMCLPTKDKHQGNDQTASSGKDDHTPETVETSGAEKDEVEEMEVNDGGDQTGSISQLDSTQDLESEVEEQNESGNVSSLGNKSMLSNSSVISSSESSPQRTEDPTPVSTPTVRYRCGKKTYFP